MSSLVLVRHGESTWNRENRFTGWEDVPLSDRGVEEALTAGRILREEGFLFDVAFTSYLKRAIKSLWIILEELDQMWIPEYKHWALNERHYGSLQGLNKAVEARKVGEQQVRLWRRGWDVPPPKIETATAPDRRYAGIAVCDPPRCVAGGPGQRVLSRRAERRCEGTVTPQRPRVVERWPRGGERHADPESSG